MTGRNVLNVKDGAGSTLIFYDSTNLLWLLRRLVIVPSLSFPIHLPLPLPLVL